MRFHAAAQGHASAACFMGKAGEALSPIYFWLLQVNPHPIKKRQTSDDRNRSQSASRQRGQSIFAVQPSFPSNGTAR